MIGGYCICMADENWTLHEFLSAVTINIVHSGTLAGWEMFK